MCQKCQISNRVWFGFKCYAKKRRTLFLTFHLLLPAAVRSDCNCRGVLSQSPKGKRISDLNATLVKHGENGAQRMVQLDAL
ncbi:uncharacterized protein P174DRAFT_270620 [Aspergillus novofumigatus IBT 16806]|uniref:Secreted protein n=1 Tax=Aspergillus novofumigatus (strain IBT 16806) TaxID=1392255 RepID=A0A2I1BZ97_ASPN1|nr:uncharacterized protein P174DRAFT_270620 [Aspergillus novofumigatus IBT 16806]PKX90683.1 hypothetical protein P174DRAFT_270620 [Aspergillus novofumigatus IBT 16806]